MLAISPNRRHLVDGSGAPWLIHGDTAWSLITALTLEETELYLADRQAKGVNAIIVNLIEHKFGGPATRDGDEPFLRAGDLTTPNEAYFHHADRVIERAARHGIVVFLAPLYLGYRHAADDEGWVREVLAMGPERCREYGRYVGGRYARHENIVWIIGGDRDPAEALEHVDAFVAGLKERDRRHLLTAHTAPESSPLEQYGRGGWLDLNATYTYGIVHRKLLADYRREPAWPFFLIESTYEGEHNASAVQVRRQVYWALLCGAAGQFMGNRPIWLFGPGWREALQSQASRDMVHVRALFTSRPWHQLVPDFEHRVVTEGLGEFRGLDYLAAARSADGSTIIAYLPTARPIAVDLTHLAGERAVGWWHEPRTGEAERIGEFATRGVARLSPPGQGDWCLVLDSAELGLGQPGRVPHGA